MTPNRRVFTPNLLVFVLLQKVPLSSSMGKIYEVWYVLALAKGYFYPSSLAVNWRRVWPSG